MTAILREFAFGMIPFLTFAALNPRLTVTFIRVCINLEAKVTIKVFLVQLRAVFAKWDLGAIRKLDLTNQNTVPRCFRVTVLIKALRLEILVKI